MLSLLQSLALAIPLFSLSGFAWPPTRPAAGKAIYILTNEATGNNVLALPIKEDGTLGAGVLNSGMGNGSTHLDPMTLQPSFPDPLLSQNSVIVAGNYLFAVNAQSNTLALFRIPPTSPTHLTHLSTTPLPGHFPTTITASLSLSLVCVGMTGARDGISCARFSSSGLSAFDALRPLGLNQTTPPTGPPNTLSQISFTSDSKLLVATTKAIPNQRPGFLSVYKASNRGVSTEETRSTPNGTALLFGFDQIPRTNNIVVSDPAYGAALLSLDPRSLSVSTVKITTISGQVAACWTAFSSLTNTVFILDGGVNKLVEVSAKDGGIVRTTDLSANGDPGLLDGRVAGGYLYALSPGAMGVGPSVVVVDVVKGAQVQHFGIKQFGVGSAVQGLATYDGENC